MQEVAEGRRAPGMLRQDECRSLLRGTGEEFYILKQDERKKLRGGYREV
jgi:hypothetical protein